jgi:tripartite-type tricarboxylate transporter receptor subunit TctC
VGIPADIINKLVKETAEAAADPVLAQKLNAIGIKPVGSTPEAFAQIIEKERPLYREAVDAAGLKMEE